ncbi:hypothetical protein K461DRAFT_283122 [Myriangium duriaei CBS 260.36]|uniref:Uncharacterized protein n=1 Tax=Myriangium duriaei CBS 260.36 TaxID=1168546 RepID=A0A9P4IUJ7_9PEZI|nr:hypothetical protein K461DRAFT_283122 [Myriangium duriaei CBS 260.36]
MVGGRRRGLVADYWRLPYSTVVDPGNDPADVADRVITPSKSAVPAPIPMGLEEAEQDSMFAEHTSLSPAAHNHETDRPNDTDRMLPNPTSEVRAQIMTVVERDTKERIDVNNGRTPRQGLDCAASAADGRGLPSAVVSGEFEPIQVVPQALMF